MPRADFEKRPVYVGANPFKGSYKRNHEGDYHCTEAEVRAMFRDQTSEGADSAVVENYTMDDVDIETLRVLKTADGFEITNPGVLKIPKEEIFLGGNSKARNPKMQNMLRMVGFGDNVGSGFPTILNAGKSRGGSSRN